MAPLRGRKCADFRGLPATPWWGIAQKRDACVFRLAKSAKTPVEGLPWRDVAGALQGNCNKADV